MQSLRLASFRHRGQPSYGAIVDAGVVDFSHRWQGRSPTLLDLIVAGEMSEAHTASLEAPDYALSEIELLPPVLGEKIICVGVNYKGRGAEYKDGRDEGKYPNLFVRFPGSLVGHGTAIVRPTVSEQFDYEGEVVLVIGRECRNVPRESAMGMIFGLTLGNEGSVRDWLRHGNRNITQGKNFDRSGSLGPWIVPAVDVDPGKPLNLTTSVNGTLRQDDCTDNLIWDFPELIHYISIFTRLKPGDLIFTGTPIGAGGHHTPPQWLKPGDCVEVKVPEIGTLRNTVIDEREIDAGLRES